MTFNEDILNYDRVVRKDKKGKVAQEQVDPLNRRRIVGDTLWNKFKERIFETDKTVLKGL